VDLTLGPIYYNWSRDDIIKFYDEVCSWPVDRVYIGEVVCSMNRELSIETLKEIGQKLVQSGKEVVISGLALVSNAYDVEMVREIFDLPYPIEANDMSVFNMNGKREIIAGPHIATYNTPSVEFLKESFGVKRIVFPVELSKDAIRHVLSRSCIEGEVIAHGKVPLAYSWRCYTLRHLGLSKAACNNNCKAYPEGLAVDTVDGESIFTINGTQILSGPVYSLIQFVDELEEVGVKALRILPELSNAGDVVTIFSDRMKGKLSADDAANELNKITKSPLCNGWYQGKEGIEFLSE
jgi:collagenase-like PrtC family protease